MLTMVQHHSVVDWPPRKLAVLVWVMELDDSRKHHVCGLSSQHEVKGLSLGVSTVY